MTDHLSEFLNRLSQSLDANTLSKLVLSKYQGGEKELVRLTVRPVTLRAEDYLSFVYQYQTREITKNHPVAEGIALIGQKLGTDFQNANLLARDGETQLQFSKKGKPSLQHHGQVRAAAADKAHNHEKHRLLDLDRPFLTDLGVTDAEQRLIPAMSRKWKQINKFLEIFSHAFEQAQLPADRPVRVLDFGSGKGYLTFAVHDWLTRAQGRAAHVTGVELRDPLVKLCMQAVERSQLQGLDFFTGDVRSFDTPQLDIMIALHACDIATDYAIHTGIRLGASVILCAPCCHKEIRPQMHSPAVMQPLLKHGIHLGQEAEMVTDGLRALLLEASGYDTQVFEFVSLEHTSKNKMILAIKRRTVKDSAAVREQIGALKAFYGIREQCLETLLAADQPTA
ncbi:MAG: SAM-dependent methyltransferase [Fluviicoccus sp.]|uniref:class I SAM-dependent methyltransferase n=1 Tax=Fluviicoccus sp. TaxID=2003552 RepID=UPI00271E1A87|nr:SAM-dependent methyltransferase [Fluviicoccus sp.]MDO8331730.1 SAM-dependent methyltransferase [Fluviicoccus sp.]